jgi:hypothetical protein
MSVQTAYPTNPPARVEGQIYDADGNEDCQIGINAEATASIPYGRVVQFYNAGGDGAVRLPTTTGDKIKGIAVISHAIDKSDRGELDAVGLDVGAVFNVLREGRVSVICEDGCTEGDRLFVRVAAGTMGACRATADGANTIDATAQGQWESTATAGALATLVVNFKTK